MSNLIMENIKMNQIKPELAENSDEEIPDELDTDFVVVPSNSRITSKKPKSSDLKSLTGIILKKSPAFFTPWQERFVMLENKKLKYFKHLGAKYPCGVINFDQFLCSVSIKR